MKETRATTAKIKSLFYEDLHTCLVLSRLSILVCGITHTGRGVKNMPQPVQDWDLALHGCGVGNS